MAFPPVCFTVLFVIFFTIPSKVQPKLPSLTAPKKIIYFCLPCTGSHSLQILTQINPVFPQVEIRFVFCSSTRISSFLPFKDKVPKYIWSGVVYSFKCRYCSESALLDQTTRYLHTRILVVFFLSQENRRKHLTLSHQHIRADPNFCFFRRF